MRTLTPIVKNLIIINVLVFVAQLTLESTLHLTEKLMLYPIMPQELRDILVRDTSNRYGGGFQPYQIATHMFAHSPRMIFHIIFNMLVLAMFGKALESTWGPRRFLFFYLACGVGAAIVHLVIQYIRCEQLLAAYLAHDPGYGRYAGAIAPALGASGAIMGVMAAFAYLYPNVELLIIPIPFPVKAKWAVLGMAALDLFGGVSRISGDNVAHFAHLGGAITGFIIVLVFNKMDRRKYY